MLRPSHTPAQGRSPAGQHAPVVHVAVRFGLLQQLLTKTIKLPL
jgi:hypothetical protein